MSNFTEMDPKKAYSVAHERNFVLTEGIFFYKRYIKQWRFQDFPETPEGLHQPIILPNFCGKLHENERI